MSIATMKRKTRETYHVMSRGNGFSLNGTHRNHTYVGQTNTSRTTPIPENNVLCACLDYDATVVIPSVVSTAGMLATKYRWIRRGYPQTSVKPDSNRSLNHSSDRTENLAKRTIKCVISDATHDLPACDYDPDIPREARTKVSYYNSTCPNSLIYNKPAYKTIEQGEYILRINNRCVSNDTLQREVNVCRKPVGVC